MEIINVKINNVTVGLDDRDRLSVRMTFAGQSSCTQWGFLLNNAVELQQLAKLMSYTGVREVKYLNEKVIRVVNHNLYLQGFGDPIEDKFVPVFGEELQEVTEDQFRELLKI